MRAVIFAAILTSTTVTTAGPCPIRPLEPQAMTVDGAEIPPDGGVLVSLAETLEWNKPSQPDLTKTSWKFVDGTKSAAPVIKLLAPGLAMFAPPAGTAAIKLDDGKRTLVTAKRVATRPLLAAPSPKSVTHRVAVVRQGTSSMLNRSSVMLDPGARPDGAVALIVFIAGKPASWVTAFGPPGPLEVFHTPGRCDTPIPGFVEPKVGSKITVAWVDAAGRIGAHSKELAVIKG